MACVVLSASRFFLRFKSFIVATHQRTGLTLTHPQSIWRKKIDRVTTWQSLSYKRILLTITCRNLSTMYSSGVLLLPGLIQLGVGNTFDFTRLKSPSHYVLLCSLSVESAENRIRKRKSILRHRQTVQELHVRVPTWIWHDCPHSAQSGFA